MESLYRLQVLVDLADQLSGPISGPLRAIDSLKSRVAQADVALEQMGQGAQLAGVGAALTLPMMGATQQAIRFETAFADVAKVVDFPSPQGAQDFQNDLMRLSNQIPLTAVQLTDIAAAAGQAGIAFNELVPFTRDAAQMAVAFDITAMQAGQSMAVLRNIFGLTQEGVVGLGDSVNALSNKMASAEPDILNVLQRVGGTGRAIGMTAEQIAALGSAMLSTGAAPEIVSTGLNAMLTRLSTATRQGKDFQSGLREIGLGARAVEAAMRKDAAGGLLEFLKIVNQSKDPIGALSDLFGLEYADDAARFAANTNLVEQALGIVGNRANTTGSMFNEFQVRSKTTSNTLQLLWNRLTNIATVIGLQLLPPINRVLNAGATFLDWVYKLTQANPQLAATLVAVVAGLGGLVAIVGLVVIGLGALGFASAQARLGLEFVKITALSVVARFTSGLAAIAAFGNRLVLMGLEARGAAGTLLLLDGGVGPMQRLSLALAGLRVMLVQGAMAARAFALSLLTNPVFLIAAAVIGLGAAFVWAWQHVDVFRQNVIQALAPLVTAWDTLRGALGGFLSALGPVGAVISGVFSGAIPVLDALGYAFGFVLGFILTLVIEVFARIGAYIMTALAGVVKIVSGAINILIGLFTGDLDKVRRGAAQVWKGVQQILSTPLNVLGTILKAIGQAVTWLTTVGVGQMLDAGRQLLEGLGRGIAGAMKSVVLTVGQVGSNIVNTFKGLLGIKSPSRVFMGLGGMIGAGLALGVAQAAPDVSSAISELANVPSLELPAPRVSAIDVPALPTLELSALRASAIDVPAPPALEGLAGTPARTGQTPRQTPQIKFEQKNEFVIDGAGGDPRVIADQIVRVLDQRGMQMVLDALDRLALEAGDEG
jgi:TP901 family phage tail tape measure protein